MSNIKRLKDFPDGSGSLTSDDVFIFMDNPSASGVTKKISLSQIASFVVGGSITLEEIQDNLGNSFLIGGTGININYNDNANTLNISTTGLQPSGNYSLVGHTHLSSQITDFNTAASLASPVQSVSGRSGIITLTKSDVGLSNIDNTSDINKPVSTAQAAADAAIQAYSIQRSNHTGTQSSSTISDFNVSVSGLLPVKNVVPGSNISISNISGVYTVSASGLVQSNMFGITGASGINNLVQISQANYDALATKDPNTVYFIV